MLNKIRNLTVGKYFVLFQSCFLAKVDRAPVIKLYSRMSSVSKQPSKRFKSGEENILERLQEERNNAGNSVADFKFNKQRVKMISEELEVPEKCGGIVYWMSRDQRVQDNWAFLFAQRIALKEELPLSIIFCLVPKFLDATYRQYHFLLNGLKEVEKECRKLKISFHLLLGQPRDVIPPFIKEKDIGGVITDFSPLRIPQQWVEDVKKALPATIPFSQVDAHNVVPCWVTSEKQEYSARTIRKKIHDKLATFLTQFPPLIKHPHQSKGNVQSVDWEAAEKSLEVDKTVGPVAWAQPGTEEGLQMLDSFCLERLKLFADKRNDPAIDALSNLSPWIHFGQISAQRCILEVNKHSKKYPASVNSYIEETLVRRELSDNYCFYQQNYDNINGASDWARATLEIHKEDKRAYVYSRKTLDEAKTHDDLWNSAQLQLIQEGKMHGFLRMYWAKKILEWTATPEEALATAIYLNDRYSLDGSDPNGFVGCMWSICGIHDQGWAERAIFGKVRYMNYAGCKRKFDVKAFIARYGGKEYKYDPKK